MKWFFSMRPLSLSLYIYIYIYTHTKSCWEYGFPSVSCHPSPLSGPIHTIQCPHRTGQSTLMCPYVKVHRKISDCLMSHPGHSLGESYLSAEMQPMYSVAPAVQVVQPCSSTGRTTARYNSRFILSKKSDSLSTIAGFNNSPCLTLTSVDEILLPKYMKWSTKFRGLQFNEEMAPSCLKHELLCDFIKTLIPLGACSRLYSRGSVWVGVFVISARSSA